MNARNKHDETKLTDYALGELHGAALDEVETLLETDLEARGEVEEIAHLSRVLRAATLGERRIDGVADSYAEIAPNAGLRAALMERLAAEEAAAIAEPRPKLTRPAKQLVTRESRISTFMALAASIAVIATSVGATAWFTSRNDEVAQYTPKQKPESQELPSPFAISDDVQYFAPGPEFKLSKEATAMEQKVARQHQSLWNADEDYDAPAEQNATLTSLFNGTSRGPATPIRVDEAYPPAPHKFQLPAPVPPGTVGDSLVVSQPQLQTPAPPANVKLPLLGSGGSLGPTSGPTAVGSLGGGGSQGLYFDHFGEAQNGRGSTIMNRLDLKPGIVDVSGIRDSDRRLKASGLFVNGLNAGRGLMLDGTAPVSGSGAASLTPNSYLGYFEYVGGKNQEGGGQKTNSQQHNFTLNLFGANSFPPATPPAETAPNVSRLADLSTVTSFEVKSWDPGAPVFDSRRGVRVSAQPMFATIPPANTFDYVTVTGKQVADTTPRVPAGSTPAASTTPTPAPALPTLTASTPRQDVEFESLINQITSTVSPEGWRDSRGTEGFLAPHDGTLNLTITQRQTVHVNKGAQIAVANNPVFGRELDRRIEDLQQRQEAEAKQREVEELEKLRRENPNFDTESYEPIVENAFVRTTDAPLSTFSIDVDTASYSNVRRFLNNGSLPPRGAVRLEEFVNYFTYDYPQPTGDDPFSVTTEAARCPWNAHHVLVRVGLKGREVHRKERPATNLVFLVDVSGSMQDENKLPLVRESLKMMVNELTDSDRVSIVVYAGNEGLALGPTGGNRKQTILEAIDRLDAGGSTNGAAGIKLAYQLAVENFIPKGVNRVVLATDGDFNVGVTSQDELVSLIEDKAKTGVFFTALGYGMGNIKDSTLEKLADKGNGNYSYIDSLAEARKVLVEQMSGTLMTIAKDVKIQIEFNPTRVSGYRLLGYENRMLAAQDFNDDKKDAGEIGAGHTVTAIYELVPAGVSGATETAKLPTVDPLKYQQAQPATTPTAAAASNELLTLKLRYKQPDGDKSKLIERPLMDNVQQYAQASGDFKFAASVAGFGMMLRDSKYKGTATYDAVLELAQEGLGKDEAGYRAEFVELVRKAKALAGK